MANGVEKAIDAAGGGPEGIKALADFMGITVQAIYRFKRKGWFPVDRARAIADRYDLPFRELVRQDIRDALLNS